MAVNELKAANTKVLKNGAVQDLTTGRIIAGAVLDRATSLDMVRRRVELKRAVVAAAANREVQDTTLYAEFGDMAYIAEASINMQRMATSPEAGKAAVMAYESLIKHSGMGEGKDADAQADPLGAAADLFRSMAEFARLIPVQAEADVIVIPKQDDAE